MNDVERECLQSIVDAINEHNNVDRLVTDLATGETARVYSPSPKEARD